MPPLSSATAARNALDEDIAITLAAAHFEWQAMTPMLNESWAKIGPRIEQIVTGGQKRTTSRASAEVAAMVDQQGINPARLGPVDLTPLIGIASDGRLLTSLLYQAVVAAGTAINAGWDPGLALDDGWDFLEKAVSTQVADANRAATSVQALLTPRVTLNTRVVNPGACSRCIALAGITDGTMVAFLRHPKCRCKNIPTNADVGPNVGTDPLDYFNSLSEAEQDRVFTKTGAQAIRDGADLHQVVNARRGMTSTVGTTQRRLVQNRFGTYTTSEGMTKRGYARSVMKQNKNWTHDIGGQKVVKNLRLMPEGIYEIAKDRDDAIRLLKLYGYF